MVTNWNTPCYLDVADEDGNSIIIDRLKSLNRYKQSRNQNQQDIALKNYLKKPSNKLFIPGQLVMKDIDSDGKKIEKGYSLKVGKTAYSYFISSIWNCLLISATYLNLTAIRNLFSIGTARSLKFVWTIVAKVLSGSYQFRTFAIT